MSFTFARSSRCLLLFSITVQDGPDQSAVDEDACNPLVDEAYSPTNMTFSTIRSIRISLIYFSTTLRSSDMHYLDRMSRVGGQTLKASKAGGEVSIITTR
jgi:hypothetical protein